MLLPEKNLNPLYRHTTHVPNFLFDIYLSLLTESELKIFLVVVRQTIGWLDKRTGSRKTRDRISISQFQQKTGLSKRGITKAIQSLTIKRLIQVTDYSGTILSISKQRKGKSYLYYSFLQPAHLATPTSAQNVVEPAHKRTDNKTTKLTKTKTANGFSGHISQLLLPSKTPFGTSEK